MRGSLKNIKIAVVLLLILSVGISALPDFCSPKENLKASKEVTSKETKKDQKENISLPTEMEAVVPFFAFDLLKDSYLISKLDFQINLEEEVYLSEPLYASKYFKTLFCFVISPNAP